MDDIPNAMAHLSDHQIWPATKAQLLETCNNLSDFSEEDKAEFSTKLPDGTYNSPEEVAKALGWEI